MQSACKGRLQQVIGREGETATFLISQNGSFSGLVKKRLIIIVYGTF